MTNVLELRDLRFHRPDGFSLEIPELTMAEGEQALIAGPSGCGKSTLLLLVAGLLEPAAGQIRIGGEDLVPLAPAARDALRARRVGMVFQTHHLLAGFTARENVAMALLFGGIPPRDHAARAAALLAELGIDRPDARVDRQSVGQQQRIAIARAAALGPDIILADEPTASLDPESAEAALELLRRTCRERGAALLLTSHDPSLGELMPRTIDFTDLAGGPEVRA